MGDESILTVYEEKNPKISMTLLPLITKAGFSAVCAEATRENSAVFGKRADDIPGRKESQWLNFR